MLMDREYVNHYWRVHEGKRRAKNKMVGYGTPWHSPATNYTKFAAGYEADGIRLKWWKAPSFSGARKDFKKLGHRSARHFYGKAIHGYMVLSETDALDDGIPSLMEISFSDKFFDFCWNFG